MDMNGFFLINRLIFLAVLAFLVLIGLIWKKFKPESWVLEEFEYHPFSAEDVPDIPMNPAFTILPSPGKRSIPAPIAGKWGMSEADRLDIFEPVSVAEYQEFLEKMRARERRKREKKKGTLEDE